MSSASGRGASGRLSQEDVLGSGDAQKGTQCFLFKPENKLKRKDSFRHQSQRKFSGLEDMSLNPHTLQTGEGPIFRGN